jgi:hypothetical protein
MPQVMMKRGSNNASTASRELFLEFIGGISPVFITVISLLPGDQARSIA